MLLNEAMKKAPSLLQLKEELQRKTNKQQQKKTTFQTTESDSMVKWLENGFVHTENKSFPVLLRIRPQCLSIPKYLSLEVW